jgi:dienelactone hydrolase
MVQDDALRVSSCLYFDGDVELEGVLACPGKPGRYPGVVVVHEWMGVGPYVAQRAKQLAQSGYMALAADVYGRANRPRNTDEAGRIAQSFRNDPQLIRRRMLAAVRYLQTHAGCSGHVAAIGYCFGGTCVLELARSGVRLAGVVNLHGRLETSAPAVSGAVQSPIMELLGAEDPLIPQESVQGFVQEMRQRDTDNRWRVEIVCEETEPAYDRVGLSSYVGAWQRDSLALDGNTYDGDELVVTNLGEAVTAIDRPQRRVVTSSGREIAYDALCSRRVPTPSYRRSRVTTTPGASSTARSTISTTSGRPPTRPARGRRASWSVAACSGSRRPTRSS